MLVGSDKKFLFAALFIANVYSTPVYSQSSNFFITHGNNLSSVDCNGILFAPITNQYHQALGAGSVWLRKQIDLRQPFTTTFILDFTDTTGVDGGAFVFQADSNSVGETYNGLGYKSINRSIAITFDALSNSQFNDPAFDHAAIQANGDINHNSQNNLAGPISIESLYTIMQAVKKFHHLITISWDPASGIFSASVDGSLFISAQNDIVQNIFNNNPLVYWGFTASNTQPKFFPADSELTFGYMNFQFGDIFPRYTTNPELDTCFGKSIQFFDNSIYHVEGNFNNIQYAKWFWNFGDGTGSTERNPPPHSFPSSGSYDIKFTVTNQLGCTVDTLTRTITLGSKPRVDFSLSSACTDSPVSFTDQSSVDFGFPVIWQWNFSNGMMSDLPDPVATFNTTGPKIISLSVQTNFGCGADTNKTVIFDQKPLIDFSFTKDCEGNVQYRSFTWNNVDVLKWQWNFGDHHSSASPDPEHFFNTNNDYTTSVWAVSTDKCVSDTIKKIIPINKVYAWAGNDTIAVKGQALFLHAKGGTSYQWNPSTGLNNPLVQDPVAILNSSQTYELVVKNQDGCEGKDTVNIKVFNEPDIFVPTAFTPNHDGRNDVLKLIAPGIAQLFYFRIYNRWGQLLFETGNISRGWDGKIGNQPGASGVYIWLVNGIDFKGKRIEKKGIVSLIR